MNTIIVETVPAVFVSQNKNIDARTNPLITDWEKKQADNFGIDTNDVSNKHLASQYSQWTSVSDLAADTCYEV